MPAYRIYFIDNDNHIARVPEVVGCANEQEAIGKAEQLVDGHDVELWDGKRLVVRLPRTS